jgi:hypothetical protein
MAFHAKPTNHSRKIGRYVALAVACIEASFTARPWISSRHL